MFRDKGVYELLGKCICSKAIHVHFRMHHLLSHIQAWLCIQTIMRGLPTFFTSTSLLSGAYDHDPIPCFSFSPVVRFISLTLLSLATSLAFMKGSSGSPSHIPQVLLATVSVGWSGAQAVTILPQPIMSLLSTLFNFSILLSSLASCSLTSPHSSRLCWQSQPGHQAVSPHRCHLSHHLLICLQPSVQTCEQRLDSDCFSI